MVSVSDNCMNPYLHIPQPLGSPELLMTIIVSPVSSKIDSVPST